MKKKLLFLLVVALVFSCCALTFTASASTNIEQGTTTSGRNYFTTEPLYIRNLSFEDKEVGTLNADGVSGMYLAMNGNGGGYEIVDADGGALNGTRSLKVTNKGYAYATRLFYVNRMGAQNNVVGETYRVSFSVKTTNATMITVEVRTTEGSNDASAFLADFRYGITNDANGVAQSVAKDLQGWTGANQKYTNGSCTVKDGVIYASFEYTITEGTAVADDVPVLLFYGASVTDPETQETQEATYIFDDIQVQNVKSASKYFTVDWDVDYNGYTEDAQVWDNQPAWANSGKLDNEWFDSQCLAISVPTGSTNAQVGGFEQREAHIEGKKLVKHAGLTYFQYDVAVDGCSMVNLWTQGYYTAIIYNGSTWYSEGNVSGFKAEVLDDGGYRLSYFIDLTENRDLEFNLNATSANGGTIYLDNLVIAHEDYTAYLGKGTYDFVNTQDVVLDFDAKGKTVNSVKLNDVALESADYTIADGKLTIKANKLATTELGKEHTVSVVTSASETAVSSVIAQNDNRTVVTVKYNGEALSKVYDGTTTAPELTLTLEGVANGHTVTCTFDKALDSANAGQRVINVTNIVLTGADASAYKLASTTLDVNITITPVQLSIDGTTVADKTYDGTPTATVTVGTLDGVIGNDDVTVTVASAVFDSKDVADASKVLVSYQLGGTAKDNYLAPANSEIDKTIAKATVTVTADAKSKTEGEADPELTYTANGLVEGDNLSGALTRTEGETVGEYDITIGTLANANYEINFTGAKLTINAKPVDPDPVDPVEPVQPNEPTEPTEPSDNGNAGVVIAIGSAVVVLAVVVVLVIIKKRKV